MAISAEMVKDLRKQSGAGIMECKEALNESGGDMDAALDILRKKGAGKAAKKADRSTKEGAVAGAVSGNIGALAELKCETDFVARNEKFQELCKGLAGHVAASEFVEDDEAFLDQPYAGEPSKSIRDILNEGVHELGENLVLGRRTRFELDGLGGFGLYIHGVGSIGALVEAKCGSAEAASSPVFQDLVKDLAMHIAAANPIALSAADVPAETLAKEKEIFEAQAKESGKPDNIIPKIVEGRVKKYYTEVCLLEQPFVKDPDKSVKALLDEAGKGLGGPVTVSRFCRLQLGE